jgi:hypothetical protein
MRFIDVLCPPALLYLLFVTIQVALDVSLGLYLTAGVKMLLGGAGVVILDALCGVDLGVVSWFIVAAPFVITALASSIAPSMFPYVTSSRYCPEPMIVAPTRLPDNQPYSELNL